MEHGDLNWLVYGRFFAFAGPHDAHRNPHTGYETLAPEDYVPYFKSRNVSLIVTVKSPTTTGKKFLKNGIDHVDMYYLDGSNPPIKILRKFLEVCEQTTGAIGVHCKSGIGKNGNMHRLLLHEAPQVHGGRNYCVVPHLPARFRHRSPATFHARDGARVVARRRGLQAEAVALDGEEGRFQGR